MSSYGWPELHEWTPTKVPTKIALKTLKTQADKKDTKHQFKGREQDAKNIKGDGQWASIGELLM